MRPKEKIIERYRSNVEKVLSEWAFIPNSLERNIKQAEIIAWMRNFKTSEIEQAIKIMENIQYYDDNEVRRIIGDLSSKIQAILGNDLKEVLFFPLGNSSASSGSMFLYQYRKELRLSEDNFKQDNFEKYLNKNVQIVFFDDIIGSGNQATRFFNKHLKDKSATCYYFSLLGLQGGISYIKENAAFETVIVGEILTEEDMAFSDNSYVFTDKKERDAIKSICEKYGNQLFKKHPLGYDNTQALIVFPHNTPNNTLPIIWGSNDNEASSGEILWKPLWNRKKEQNKSRKKKAIASGTESFFDIMIKECHTIKEKLSSFTNMQIVEEQNSDFISYDIRLNNNSVFFKVARNIFFDMDKSVLIWLYKNKHTSEDASFNAIVEQYPESIKVINLGMFLGRDELETSFLSIEDFIKDVFNEINLFIKQNYA